MKSQNTISPSPIHQAIREVRHNASMAKAALDSAFNKLAESAAHKDKASAIHSMGIGKLQEVLEELDELLRSRSESKE